MTDAQLAQISAGDPHAFGQWVAGSELRIRLSLKSFATRIDTEAVVQETLLRVWQTAPRVQPDGRPEPLTRYAIRIARNLAVSELRHIRADPMELEQLLRLADQAATDTSPDPLLRRLIDKCRQLLPQRPATALAARLQAAGRSHDREVAEQAGMSLNTFLQNVRRARQHLLACLAEHDVHLDLP